jgi:hypothetical protein
MEDLEIKPVPSVPGLFARSDGCIKIPEFGNRKTRFIKGCITRSSKNAKHKYRKVYNRTLGNLKVHQLVCEAFNGPKPSSQHVVSHLNEDPLDNRPENLTWATQKENLNMPKFKEYCCSRTGENSPTIKGRNK